MPPHMRNQQAPTPPSVERNPEDGYTMEELSHQFNCKHKVGTLNSNDDLGKDWDPSSLAFIVLFRDQHPQWPNKICCKTNLNLLPADPLERTHTYGGDEPEGKQPTITAPNKGPGPLSGPIPVFTELPRAHVPGGRPDKRYTFTHYYSIMSVIFLAPQSKELVQMLDTKFTPERKKRSAEAWKASLGMKWAVVELERADDGELKHPMVPLKEIKKKSVNERLEEMRLGKENGGQKEFKRAAWGKDEEGGAGEEGEIGRVDKENARGQGGQESQLGQG